MNRILGVLCSIILLSTLLVGCSQKVDDVEVASHLGIKALSQTSYVENYDKAEVTKRTASEKELGMQEYGAFVTYYYIQEEDATTAVEEYKNYLVDVGYVMTPNNNGSGVHYSKDDVDITINDAAKYNGSGDNNGKYFIIILYAYN